MRTPTVHAVRNGQIMEVRPEEVDLELLTPNHFLAANANSIPMPSSVAGPRLFYGARFGNQTVSLQNPEAALVQNLADDDEEGRSFDEILGARVGALRADQDGVVTKITPDYIELKLADGTKAKQELYNNFAFNRKSGITQTPVVEIGQAIKARDLLARSNYTDDKGVLAMGANAYTAIVPYKGHTMDDAIVISADFAKKLTSEHMTTEELALRDGTKLGREHFRSLFPKDFTKDQLGHIDDEGVALPGSVLKAGDPYILATAPRTFSSRHTETLGKLSRAARQIRRSNAQVWKGPGEALVTDVVKGKKGVKVVIKAYKPAKVGDKLSYRAGQKNTISRIIPMDRMPRDSQGRPFDALLNPLSLPSRVNDETPYELLLGKVAKKLGQAIKMPGFTGAEEYWYDVVERKLQEAGVEPEDLVYDPEEDRYLDQPVTTGYGLIQKLHHTSESKRGARGQAAYDTAWDQPAKGGETGAKRHSGLEMHAAQAAGAYALNRENVTLRGQRNDDYWRALRAGRTPIPPGRSFAFRKFFALLQGAGMNPREIDKNKYRLGPMTDKVLDEMNPVTVKNGDLVDLITFDPKPGGLFDPRISGGNRWGRIPLDHAVPNPAYEESVRRLLGLTKKQFEAVMAGEMDLPKMNKVN